MQNDILISVVVPVFNSEKYIIKCLESLKEQTFMRAEFIIVNDGSSDNSLGIIQELTKEDNRFVVITQENQGVSAARNRGLREVKGKYLMFVDSDDALINSDCLEYLYEKMSSTGVDVVAYGSIHTCKNQDSVIQIVTKEMKIVDLDKDRVEAAKVTINNSNYRYSVWNKIYRTSIIVENKIQFISYSDVISEDKVFNQHYFVFAKKALLLNDVLYKYSVIEESLSHSRKYYDVVKRVEKTIEQATKYYNILKPDEQTGLFWPVYLDCLSICTELLYSFNGLSWRSVKNNIIELLDSTTIIRKKYDLGKLNIANMTNDKKKNMFYRVLCSLIRKNLYITTANVLLIKSKIRKIMKGKL